MLFKYHAPLIRDLIKNDAEIHLIAPALRSDKVYAPLLSSMGAQLHDIALERNGMNPLTDIGLLIGMVRLLRKIRPNAILSYTAKPVIYGTIAAFFAGVENRVALIVGLGYGFTGEATGKRALVRRITATLYRIALTAAGRVCFQNRDDAEIFKSLEIVGDRNNVTVVNGCGIDLDVFRQLPFPAGPITFLFIGRLLGDKGVRELVSAAQHLRGKHEGVRVVLLGGLDTNPDAVSEEELQAWLARGDVEWLGYREDVAEVLASSHVFVLPSYREGLPQSTLEALASGRPVVTTSAPGCRETVIDGVNGFMVPVGDAEALAGAMQRFIEDPALIAQMGKASRSFVEEKFDVRLVNHILTAALLGGGKAGSAD